MSQIVVMIEGKGSELAPELPTFGSGIVFGVRDREAFFVVPRHVIRSMRGDIRVRFKEADGTSDKTTYIAQIDREELAISHVDPNRLLAVIEKNVPDALSVLRVALPAKRISALQAAFDCVADLDFVDPASGIFYVVGNPGGVGWSVAVTGLVPFEEKRPGDLLLLDGVAQPGAGASGGALTTSNWELVGMYFGQSALGAGVALNVETLIDILEAHPEYPVHLDGGVPELTLDRLSARAIVTPIVDWDYMSNYEYAGYGSRWKMERLVALRALLGLRLSQRWDIIGMASYGFGLQPAYDKLHLGVGTRFRLGESVDVSLVVDAAVGFGPGADLGVSIKTPFWVRIECGFLAELSNYDWQPVYGLRLGLGIGD
ncbi:MAG: trypsin-like peptidase domain-containing protein [Myxococcaceae bacterium]|nr:trypsin-like peptidase domain-containing protein [Myxococcaceae bacterium]